ncbi:hypothetical protein [Lysinibacillus sphaericus]|uniref:Uncharacterized protein n=1 Tax=Lysinibacillus sphaericus (strain C3-41) TaxID=444177 RepID=B1I0J6_LYSSC|nr:hypothetical protein [Lysinibacillus sphaericus]MBE5085798.1 hypothetical protein [Bacillus thuringiensis]ACA42355.1 hypothetical protein Bsph_p125 [Lysinibacillus sphaericus C3-41]AMO35339.1 hypothetical protein AR327_22880 [Lysinibacillus sphaericus]AMR93058.1 hypothetical protein A1T07_22905 [Lysinibacillus sphaericus]MBG9710602.1 hypothetical protein [Lysinibacillus sphaericus]
MNLKTAANWKWSLHQYLQVGDIVDDEIYSHFVNVLPPATFKQSLVQMGEPYCHVEGQPTYPTLQKTEHGWKYMGNCFRGEVVNKD